MEAGLQFFYMGLSIDSHECPWDVAANTPQGELSKRGRSRRAFHDFISEATHQNIYIILVLEARHRAQLTFKGRVGKLYLLKTGVSKNLQTFKTTRACFLVRELGLFCRDLKKVVFISRERNFS